MTSLLAVREHSTIRVAGLLQAGRKEKVERMIVVVVHASCLHPTFVALPEWGSKHNCPPQIARASINKPSCLPSRSLGPAPAAAAEDPAAFASRASSIVGSA